MQIRLDGSRVLASGTVYSRGENHIAVDWGEYRTFHIKFLASKGANEGAGFGHLRNDEAALLLEVPAQNPRPGEPFAAAGEIINLIKVRALITYLNDQDRIVQYTVIAADDEN